MKPNEILALKKENAKYKKQAEAFKAQLARSIKASNILSKEELDSAYDPEDPSSTQKAINAHNTKVQSMIDEAYAEVDKSTEEYLKTEYSDDKMELTAQLAEFNTTKNTNLTYEQLTEELPPKFMKQFKEGEFKTTDELFEVANDYLTKVGGVYNPQPPKTPNGTPNATPDPIDGDDEDELY